MPVILLVLAASLAWLASARASAARYAVILALGVVACGTTTDTAEPARPDPAVGVAQAFDAARAPDAAGADASLRKHPPDFTDKHLVFDDELDGGVFAPKNHAEMLWGDYIDRQGNPAVGWHSHDPVTGNAQ